MKRELLTWYEKHKEVYPWDLDKSAYSIWVSEIILQQTQVVQGLNYYERFIAEFPTVTHLAESTEEQVLELWQGLGYYSRARNLRKGAQYVVESYEGRLPRTRVLLEKIPGIGPYTASAILSFAYEQAEPAIDGNLYRILSRLVYSDIDRSKRSEIKTLRTIGLKYISKKSPADWNRAMMYLGRTICTARNPKCEECPIQKHCLAYAACDPERFPAKKTTKPKKERYFHYLWLESEGHIWLQKRASTKDIWRGLYELPLVETKNKDAPSLAMWNIEGNEGNVRLEHQEKRVLSHQNIYLFIYHLNVSKEPKTPKHWLKTPITDLGRVPFHRSLQLYAKSKST